MSRHVGVVADPLYYEEFQRGNTFFKMCPKCDQAIAVCQKIKPNLEYEYWQQLPEHQCSAVNERREVLIRRIFQ